MKEKTSRSNFHEIDFLSAPPPHKIRRRGFASAGSFPLPLLFLVLLLVSLVLLVAPRAQAQRTIWSATLTVRDFGHGLGLGCDDDRSITCSNNLTDNDFTHGGTDYLVRLVTTRTVGASQQDLSLELDKAIPLGLTLHVGNRSFTFTDDNITLSDPDLGNVLRFATWTNTGLSSWSENQKISLRLVDPSAAPPPPPPPPPPVIESPKGVLVGNADQSLPITLKEGDSVPITPLEEEGSFVYRKRTIDIPVTRDECTSPGNPAVILSKEILDRVYDRSQEIAFKLSGTSPQDPPPGFRMEGCALEIDPGVALRQGETVTVCLPLGGIQGKSYIRRYNDESEQWEPLPLEMVDDDELLCGETDTFSQFRVLVPVVIGSEEVAYRGDPEDDVFPLTPIGEGGSIVYGPGTIDLSVTGDTDPSYANPAVIVSRSILDRVDEITFELSEVSEYPPPGYRLSGFEAEVNLGIPLRQRETVSVCLPSSGGEEDIYYRYNDESEEWEVLESQLDTVNGEDVLCGDAGAVSLSGVFVEETGGCVIAAAGGEGVLWRGAVFNLLLIMSVLLLIPRKHKPGVYDRKAESG